MMNRGSARGLEMVTAHRRRNQDINVTGTDIGCGECLASRFDCRFVKGGVGVPPPPSVDAGESKQDPWPQTRCFVCQRKLIVKFVRSDLVRGLDRSDRNDCSAREPKRSVAGSERARAQLREMLRHRSSTQTAQSAAPPHTFERVDHGWSVFVVLSVCSITHCSTVTWFARHRTAIANGQTGLIVSDRQAPPGRQY